MASTSERFWAKVDKTDTCWLWTAAKDRRGYGYFGIAKGHVQLAHRFAWENQRGLIPEGLVIDHLCRNTSCVNPDHLEPVTQRVNVQRGNAVLPHVPRTHCKRGGHMYTPETTYVAPGGKRTCRICYREYDRNRKRALRQAVA